MRFATAVELSLLFTVPEPIMIYEICNLIQHYSPIKIAVVNLIVKVKKSMSLSRIWLQ